MIVDVEGVGVRVEEPLDVDLNAVVPCADRSCEAGNPPAVDRLRSDFACHTHTFPVCEPCAVTWSRLIAQDVFRATYGGRSLCACLMCGVGHDCCAANHYQLIGL